MGRPITNFTIVGGGTAGWIAAAYLNQRLQRGAEGRRDVKITVIESPDIGVIGVGEATVPNIKATMQHLGISEPEFMARVDATFKLGIWFDRWNVNDKDELIGFLHPFTGGRTLNGVHPAYPFKKYGLPGHKHVTDQDLCGRFRSCAKHSSKIWAREVSATRTMADRSNTPITSMQRSSPTSCRKSARSAVSSMFATTCWT